MAKLKNLIIAAGALALLVGALALIPQAPGHSQAGEVEGFPVKVVNSGNSPVPTLPHGTTTIAGTVQANQGGTWTVGLTAGGRVGIDPASSNINVANTPTVNLAANSNVNVANTPTVNLSAAANAVRIANTAASPALVRDIDEARQPVQAVASVTLPAGATSALANFVFDNNVQLVPAGKRLVIEQISARAIIASGYAAIAAVDTRVGTRTARHFLVLNGQGYAPPGIDRAAATQLVRIYADPGTPVVASMSADAGLPPGVTGDVLTVTLSGYLVDL